MPMATKIICKFLELNGNKKTAMGNSFWKVYSWKE